MKKIWIAAAVLGVVVGASGCDLEGQGMAKSGVDGVKGGDESRAFTGVIAGKPFAFRDSVEIEIRFGGEDGETHTHVLADVAVRNRGRSCGDWKSESVWGDPWVEMVGEPEVERVVGELLPVGAVVTGYAANIDDKEDPWSLGEIITGSSTTIEGISYLHSAQGIDVGESINEQVVSTGWARGWGSGGGLELRDPVVAGEHQSVMAVSRADKVSQADAICGDRESEQEDRREERRERHHAWVIAEAERERQAEQEDYADDGVCFCAYDGNGSHPDRSNPNYDWSEDWIYHPEDYSDGGSGGSGSGSGSGRCYAPGGDSWSPC